MEDSVEPLGRRRRLQPPGNREDSRFGDARPAGPARIPCNRLPRRHVKKIGDGLRTVRMRQGNRRRAIHPGGIRIIDDNRFAAGERLGDQAPLPGLSVPGMGPEVLADVPVRPGEEPTVE